MPFASITPLVAAVKGLVVNEIREGEGRWRVKSFYMKRIGILGDYGTLRPGDIEASDIEATTLRPGDIEARPQCPIV